MLVPKHPPLLGCSDSKAIKLSVPESSWSGLNSCDDLDFGVTSKIRSGFDQLFYANTFSSPGYCNSHCLSPCSSFKYAPRLDSTISMLSTKLFRLSGSYLPSI